MSEPFVHLRARSAYSLLESTLQIDDLARLCVQHGMPALGLTDTNNLFGALEFCEAFSKKGLQAIIGCGLMIEDGGAPLGCIALLAQSEQGYANLMLLSSQAFRRAVETGVPAVSRETLAAASGGLIALTGGVDGPLRALQAARREGDARRLLEDLLGVFGDRLYVELQRHREAGESEHEAFLIAAAYELGLPLVATNDLRFEAGEDHGAHDALMCIAAGSYLGATDRPRVGPHRAFLSSADMEALFSDLPEALENTAEIARRCAYMLKKVDPMLPRFTGDQGRDESAELVAQAEDGLRMRLAAMGPAGLAAPEDIYWQRLKYECDVIIQMKFPGYFLIVSDFIKWAKAQGIPVGPGRGSGAGSLVAYALTITDLDPLRFGLLFERFLNPERVSMPDFDIDFCQERRGEVIEYVQRRYGHDRVAQIITFGTLQARAVLRDVGRVMQLPFPLVDRLAKLVPANPANPVTLAKAIEMEPRLQEAKAAEADVANLLRTAMQLEGLYRNASTHAAGIVIGDRPLDEVVALYQDPRSDIPATQFNMKWVEGAGLVKFDFLGLKTLTVLDRALGFLRQQGISIDLAQIPFDDAKTYDLLGSGMTFGVFQLESQGMRDTLRKVKPNKLDDIIALISLYRPGPMKNIDHYAAVKFGAEKPDYLHPSLQPYLEETYGVIIYQEQVMQIAQELSGYSLGQADLLRRAMGKKKPEEMAKQKSVFLDGAAARGVDRSQAERIFDLVEEFAGYGFNKSHAAAYAVVAFQTAYLKAHYPVEFIAASMSLDIANSEKLASFHQDARRMGVKVLPPDVNASLADFGVEDGAIRYALGAVRNVGLAAMGQLVAERERNGPFKDMFDLAERFDGSVVNRRQLENMAKAGAFDGLLAERARAHGACDTLAAYSARRAEERASSQGSLFGAQEASLRPPLPKSLGWSEQQRLDFERESVGFYFSGHPLQSFFLTVGDGQVSAFSDVLEEGETDARTYAMAGVVRRVMARPARDGGLFAYVAFSDPTGDFETMVVPEAFEMERGVLEVGKALAFRARARWRDGDLKITADSFEPIEAMESRRSQVLQLDVREGATLRDIAAMLRALPEGPSVERRPLRLRLRLFDGREVELSVDGGFPAGATARAAIKSARGVERVS
ncbi:MAG: DNA polymerase III subunit alpha [Caulobacterales bacterium]